MGVIVIGVPHSRYFLQRRNDKYYEMAFEYFSLFNEDLNKAMTIQIKCSGSHGIDHKEDMEIVHSEVGVKSYTKAQEVTKSLSKRNMIEMMDKDEELTVRSIPSHWHQDTHYSTEESAKEAIVSKFSPLIVEIHSFLFEDDTYASYSGVMGTW